MIFVSNSRNLIALSTAATRKSSSIRKCIDIESKILPPAPSMPPHIVFWNNVQMRIWFDLIWFNRNYDRAVCTRCVFSVSLLAPVFRMCLRRTQVGNVSVCVTIVTSTHTRYRKTIWYRIDINILIEQFSFISSSVVSFTKPPYIHCMCFFLFFSLSTICRSQQRHTCHIIFTWMLSVSRKIFISL